MSDTDKEDVFVFIMSIPINAGLAVTILVHWIINLPLALLFKMTFSKELRPSFSETIDALSEAARSIWMGFNE